MAALNLRPTIVRDLDFVLAAERSAENRDLVGQWSLAQHQSALSDLDIKHLIVEDAHTQRALGYIILAGITSPNESIEFRRIVVAEKGRGYGKQALRLVKQLVFEQIGAHRLWLDVLATNLRARHVYEYEGFVVEGTLRECFKVGDKFESLVVMAMLRREYKAS